jgi:hypothetical protein
MAVLTRGARVGAVGAAVAVVAWLLSCGDLVGLGGPATPLAQVRALVTGDLASVRPPGLEGETPRLRVALVWGAQWLPEPFCFLPPESSDAAAVQAAGCPDSFGFVPNRVAANAAVEPGAPATLDLMSLPAADVMVGDVTARIAYAGLVVYDDRNGNETLDLHRPPRHWEERREVPAADAGLLPTDDVVYGASFLSMTLPDQRLAFREGDFGASVAFYPRAGCPPPAPGFSVLAAGGFSASDAIAAALEGRLPQQDPATCSETTLDQALVSMPLQAPEGVKQVACKADGVGGTTRYREPPADAPDLANLAWACVGLSRLPNDDGGTGGADVVQLVIATAPGAACKRVVHYALSCQNDAACGEASWDLTGTPPAWWPCATTR